MVHVEPLPKVPMVFYRSPAGREPVRDWLKAMDRSDRLAVGADLQRVQYRWPVGMPLCRSLGCGLWEVRTSLPSRAIARVLFCFHAQVLYALHGFVKKTQTTPAEVLTLARERMKEIQHGEPTQRLQPR
jgi:phage-related protein